MGTLGATGTARELIPPPAAFTGAPRPKSALKKHPIDPYLVGRRDSIHIFLIGAGGNGSRMLSGLAQLHTALVALGQPGLTLEMWDPDTVSESNVGRQLYYPADVGQYKSICLVHRVNMCFGLDWQAVPHAFPADPKVWPGGQRERVDILITCVDSAKARRNIHRYFESQGDWLMPRYWLDLGNLARVGQVVLGQPERNGDAPWKPQKPRDPAPFYTGKNRKDKAKPASAAVERVYPSRLPTIVDVFPDILDVDYEEEDLPSCSLAEALERQDLFINQAMATFGLDLLWRLLREGGLNHHGAFINLESGHVNPLKVGGSVK